MWSFPFRGVVVAVALVLGLSLLIGTPAEGSPEHRAPRPVLTGRALGDPSIVLIGHDRLMVATGRGVLRAALRHGSQHWRWRTRALTHLPRWAGRGGVWAPDLARVGNRWVLYFAAPVRGLGGSAHCIGVATSPTAYGRFRPSDVRPLVCQKGARSPRAYDMVRGTQRLPRRGVIDPSYFRDRSGHSYLLYKTAGQPSSIRILPLARGGLARRPHTHSRELLRSRGTVENPVVIRKGRGYVLLTSEGSWSTCGYRETWRTSPRLGRWPAAGRPLMTQRSMRGICGPGGADVVRSGRRSIVYFHGWVRRHSNAPLRGEHQVGDRARRAMYAARLRWRHGRPVVRGWVSR